MVLDVIASYIYVPKRIECPPFLHYIVHGWNTRPRRGLFQIRKKIWPTFVVRKIYPNLTYFPRGKLEKKSPDSRATTVKYEDNTKIDQEEHEVRSWVSTFSRDGRVEASRRRSHKAGITYLRNRLTGNILPVQRNYNCAHMYEVLLVWCRRLIHRGRRTISTALSLMRLLG